MFVLGSVPLKVPETSKYDPPLSPYPRHIWVHPKAPKDDFDIVCHEIWKRAQHLPEGLKPLHGKLTTKTEEAYEESYDTTVRSVHGNSTENDIPTMIEQEHLNLIAENLNEHFSGLSIKEFDRQVIDKRAEALKIEKFIKSVLAKGNTSKNLKAKKCYIQDRSSSELRSGSLDKEDICSIEYSKMEARKLQAQFTIKSANRNNVTITKTKMEVVNNGKNIFSFYKEGRRFETASKDDKNQLKVIPKFCAKAYHHAGIAVPMHAVASAGNETEWRNMKKAGPIFMPPTSVAEVPINQPYFPPMPAFCMPNAMNYDQMEQASRPMFYMPYRPMTPYMPYMHPYYQMRGFQDPNPVIRPHCWPTMAGDGPQCHLPRPYWFNPPISRATVNNQKFSSSGNCIKPF
ncbi:uncharacterized protein C1orf94 homolog [Anomaloglossus baeobatrachus]|uniref:uncharacterized protein C1orf94 homolog n=1 Tax=Anomaloglossus baeobatrachus TaxID=238106 RepID=UPI003F50C5C0